ncbi:MAG: hypothetical protein DMF61_22030 [Blastocatellia bacterium AA13]|nr:MAG: hypothetical protein DMF61_22030 [Blastocatellia bacterium AA13]
MLKRVPSLTLVKQAFASFMHNDLTTAAAAVSYFSMLALFPTLLVLLVIGNATLGPAQVQKYVIGEVLSLLPGAQSFVSKNLDSISNISAGLVASCLLVMIWAASWMFTVIEKALNRIWNTSPRSFFRGRAVNFAVMSSVWILLGVSSLFTAFVSSVRAAANRLPVRLDRWIIELGGYAWQSVFIAASVAVTILLFTVVYKWLPNTRIPISEALTGAVLSALLWEPAKFGFAYLLPYFHYDLLYGSIGAGVALLTWVYMSSNILLFGAQFTALLHREHLFDQSRKRALGTQELTAGDD